MHETPSVNYGDDPAYIERFVMESWIGNRIQNPHVTKVIETNKAQYYLTEYIDGITLQQWIKENPRPDVKEVISMVDPVVKGLRAFHLREILHQDIKPGNIMLDKTARPNLWILVPALSKALPKSIAPLSGTIF